MKCVKNSQLIAVFKRFFAILHKNAQNCNCILIDTNVKYLTFSLDPLKLVPKFGNSQNWPKKSMHAKAKNGQKCKFWAISLSTLFPPQKRKKIFAGPDWA